ncbi:hypothetical protein BaRGS_00039462 [Batillaria attramentaria]|uniref:CLIP1 zinc knuckle domain-containing protein n=1 Tax=Batillaria attramentaria TaxID=370345 RepID=A0ABD0J3X7_9CAEN
MKNSGDSSKQLSTLNEQLAEKTRRLEELQSDLSNYSQQIPKLKETIEEQQRAKEKEKEEIVNKYEEQLKSLQSQLEDMEAEIQQLKQKLEAQTEELSKQEVQTQAHKDYLDKITLDLEAMKYEKEKTEKSLRRVEGERDAANTELIQVKVDLSKLQSMSAETGKTQTALKEQIEDLQAEKDRALQSKLDVEKQREDLKAEKEKVTQERDHAAQELVFLKADMQKRTYRWRRWRKRLHALQMDRLRLQTEEKQEQLMQRSQTEADMLTEELEGSKKVLQETQMSLKEKEAELNKLKAELELSRLVAEERQKLEAQKADLLKDMEQLKESHRQQVAAMEAEKAELCSKADSSSQELQQQQRLVEEHMAKMSALEKEKQELLAAKMELESREQGKAGERHKLAERVAQLEASLAQAEKAAESATVGLVQQVSQGSGEPGSALVVADKEAVDQQVAFLNSVIVDLQRKNQELEVRLEAMESGAYNGDMELMPDPGSRSRPAPRVFCDICDVFDLHDTDDCPKQAMSDSPPPSLHHGDRKSCSATGRKNVRTSRRSEQLVASVSHTPEFGPELYKTRHQSRGLGIRFQLGVPHSPRSVHVKSDFIDPQAVHKHSHSKLIDSFFQQCIGFSDEDLDEDFVKKNYRNDVRNDDLSSPELPPSSSPFTHTGSQAEVGGFSEALEPEADSNHHPGDADTPKIPDHQANAGTEGDSSRSSSNDPDDFADAKETPLDIVQPAEQTKPIVDERGDDEEPKSPETVTKAGVSYNTSPALTTDNLDAPDVSSESDAHDTALRAQPQGQALAVGKTDVIEKGPAGDKDSRDKKSKGDKPQPHTDGTPSAAAAKSSSEDKGGNQETNKGHNLAKQDKKDNPDPQDKGEKQEKVEKREKQQLDKQEKVKKRASAGATLGGEGSNGGSANGADRPESCVVS